MSWWCVVQNKIVAIEFENSAVKCVDIDLSKFDVIEDSTDLDVTQFQSGNIKAREIEFIIASKKDIASLPAKGRENIFDNILRYYVFLANVSSLPEKIDNISLKKQDFQFHDQLMQSEFFDPHCTDLYGSMEVAGKKYAIRHASLGSGGTNLMRESVSAKVLYLEDKKFLEEKLDFLRDFIFKNKALLGPKHLHYLINNKMVSAYWKNVDTKQFDPYPVEKVTKDSKIKSNYLVQFEKDVKKYKVDYRYLTIKPWDFLRNEKGVESRKLYGHAMSPFVMPEKSGLSAKEFCERPGQKRKRH